MKYAMDNEDFRKDFNPLLAPWAECEYLASGSVMRLPLPSVTGEVRDIRIRDYIKRKQIEKKKGLQALAWSSRAFREAFDQTLNPDLCIEVLTKSSGRAFRHYLGDGTVAVDTVGGFIRSVEGKRRKRRDHIFYDYELDLERSAADVDPGITAFWDPSNPCLPDETAGDSSKRFLFRCPHCGETFKKSLRIMVLRSPKCPYCADTGRPLPGPGPQPASARFVYAAPRKG